MYKIIGILDIILGSIFSIFELILLFIVYPKLQVLYEGFDAELPTTTKLAPYIMFVILIIFLSIVFIGVKLLKSPTDKLSKLGLIGFIVLILISGYFTAASILSVINPIYHLTTF